MTMKKTLEPVAMQSASLAELTREMLLRLGEDPQREGLQRTPERMAQALEFLTKGYQEDPQEILRGALFTEEYDEMVIVKDVEMFSLCEHHLLPFFGKVHVAYIHNGKVIGLSKIPRLIDVFARRLQVQERLTMQIAESIQQAIAPEGLELVLERGERIGKKMLISGGGRCNFTNLYCQPENFLSDNPHFCRSALVRYTPADFIALVEKHGIAYHEKTLGQLFCDGSSSQIVRLLESECRVAGVNIEVNQAVQSVSRDDGFDIRTELSQFHCSSLVVATGGLS